MPITIESLTAQLNEFEMQRIAAANAAHQAAGSALVVRQQLEMLLQESQDGQANKQAEECPSS